MSELVQFSLFEDGDSTETTAKLSDSEARLLALDTRVSAIVEAPAGSGKTGLLLQRYLKLLAEGGVVQPEEVLAITFTRKATAELRERVLEQLYDARTALPLPANADNFKRETRALAEAVLAADARMGWRLLEQPQRLRIRTIDALCAEIAHALPLLSGSGTSQPVESAEPLYREAARRTLLELGGGDATLNHSLETVLLHRDGNLNDCETLLARMLEHRQQWGELVPLDAASLTDEHLDIEVRPRLERSLDAIVSAGLRRALEVVPHDVLVDLWELVVRLSGEPSYHPTESSPIAVCAGRTEPPGTRAEDLKYWLALLRLLFTKAGDWRKSFRPSHLRFNISYEDGDALKDLVARLENKEELAETLSSIQNLPPPRFPDEQWAVAKALFRQLRQALAHLKVLFAETGQCDFSELALAACGALSAEEGADDLARSPGARLTHLLVDEMQDTSSSQYTLLERLTRSWDGHSQTIFLVGDPKQSIYLFRQARVERFLRTVAERRLGEIPLEALRLSANFRSQAALVDGFNDAFSQIFPQSAVTAQALGEEREVPFVHAEATRARSSHPQDIVWHTELLGSDPIPNNPDPTPQDNRTARLLREAREIRQVIDEWRALPLPDGRTRPWSIAILARARRHFTPITAELSHDYGSGPVPFRAVDIDSLAERPEVLDALALTRALLHPADRIAWLAVLRAPWCGLPLADLLRLTGEGPDSDPDATIAELVAARKSLLSATGQLLLDRVWPTLEQAAATLGRTTLVAHVERTWLSLGGDAPLSLDRMANVRRFFQVVNELEQDSAGYIDSSALGARLSTLYAETTPDDHAVQLLTIHNSKGLEFDVVLIPGLERVPNRNRSDLLNWLELDTADGEAAHILLAPIASRGEQSTGLNQWVRGVKRSRENAETRRLFYVACTRAREALHLFAACEQDRNGMARTPIDGTLLRAAWPMAAPQFATHNHRESADDAAVEGPAIRGRRLPFAAASGDGLTFAAAAEDAKHEPRFAVVHRLPRDFDPLARFTSTENLRLPYMPASDLAHMPSFDRPEGSFGVRAFGNVVHRFLQLLGMRCSEGATAETLLAELPSWEPRITAALRNEGVAPTLAQRKTPRAFAALQNTLEDPVGRWILANRESAASERSIAAYDSSVLRADRTFLAGVSPLAEGKDRVWIIDFKTTEQGSRSPERFRQDELLKYRAQLERYAAVLRELSGTPDEISLGLYYPLIPQLLHWSA